MSGMDKGIGHHCQGAPQRCFSPNKLALRKVHLAKSNQRVGNAGVVRAE